MRSLNIILQSSTRSNGVTAASAIASTGPKSSPASPPQEFKGVSPSATSPTSEERRISSAAAWSGRGSSSPPTKDASPETQRMSRKTSLQRSKSVDPRVSRDNPSPSAMYAGSCGVKSPYLTRLHCSVRGHFEFLKTSQFLG